MNSERQQIKYLAGYSDEILGKVAQLVESGRLGEVLLKKYPKPHGIRTERALYDYAVELKNRHLSKSQPLSKVVYDPSICDLNDAIGLHTFVSRVQGAKLKAKHEIRIASLFKVAPL